MANLNELFQQKAALEAAIKAAQSEARKGAIAQIREIATAAGLTADDVAEIFSAAPRKARVAKAGGTGGTGAKAPVKYRDGNGNAWSGRGLPPRWIKEAEAAGKSRDSFKV